MTEKKRVCIGIPCYQDVSFEVLDDYMRFAYYLGRRYQEYDFFLAIKGKSEQFRARNSIVKSAITLNCDYLLMLDDDHVIDIDNTVAVSGRYEFLRTLIQHIEDDPKKGIVGALYFHRGGSGMPVLMRKEGAAYSFMERSDISRRLQMVDVTGGGCMVINMEVFDKIPSPWFEPELDRGTDIQICNKVRDAGYTVWCDTSIDIGHIKATREVVKFSNVEEHREKAREWLERPDIKNAPRMSSMDRFDAYKRDVLEYTKLPYEQLDFLAMDYHNAVFPNFDVNNLEEYYKNIGVAQLARNMMYHSLDWVVAHDNWVIQQYTGKPSYGLDFGCGSSPVGFELAKRGHKLDLVDIPGSEADKFQRWRTEKYELQDSVGFELAGPYDWILLFDIIEHLREEDVEPTLKKVLERLEFGGTVLTNFWHLTEMEENIEHIYMDRERVGEIFEGCGLTMSPILRGRYYEKGFRWIKC